MEPVTLTLGAIAAGLVAKAAERAGDRAVEGGENVLRRLVSRVRERFGDDEPAARALALVERTPDDGASVKALAARIAEHATVDPDFRRDLDALVQRAGAEGIDVDAVRQIASGDGNVQIAGLSESQVGVSYGTPPPDRRTG